MGNKIIFTGAGFCKALNGYLPKKFSLNGDDKEDVKRFLKTN